jgi:homogentisate 1,2-dioxygenase
MQSERAREASMAANPETTTLSKPAERSVRASQKDAATRRDYLAGFGNQHQSEALAGALPLGQNSPQQPPLGLMAEHISGTAFTAPRAENQHTWVYRIRPSVMHSEFKQTREGELGTAPLNDVKITPNRYRWGPWPIPAQPTDFIGGLTTLIANGNAEEREGAAVHVYAVNQPMVDRVFANFDGELLIVPEQGSLLIVTELGVLEVEPCEIALIPRGIKFRVELPEGTARGFVGENYGVPFRLPELGPIGSNGLANPRDWLAPVAAYEDRRDPIEFVVKFGGDLWIAQLPHSPFDVVAWHGNYAPMKYDLTRFNAMNTVTYEHADPSIFTVLHSPSGLPGTANVDFAVFPPRWFVAEHTFRPPWFHRNTMSEFVAGLRGTPEARARGYTQGSCHMHNCMAAHGPDPEVFKHASSVELKPTRDENYAVMFESHLPFRVSGAAQRSEALRKNYDHNWDGMPQLFRG